jgi:hypothetical protein
LTAATAACSGRVWDGGKIEKFQIRDQTQGRIMNTAYLVAGVRTPSGRYGGAVGTVRPDDLAVYVVRSLGISVLLESA